MLPEPPLEPLLEPLDPLLPPEVPDAPVPPLVPEVPVALVTVPGLLCDNFTAQREHAKVGYSRIVSKLVTREETEKLFKDDLDDP